MNENIKDITVGDVTVKNMLKVGSTGNIFKDLENFKYISYKDLERYLVIDYIYVELKYNDKNVNTLFSNVVDKSIWNRLMGDEYKDSFIFDEHLILYFRNKRYTVQFYLTVDIKTGEYKIYDRTGLYPTSRNQKKITYKEADKPKKNDTNTISYIHLSIKKGIEQRYEIKMG